MSAPSSVTTLVVGDHDHGVVRHARRTAAIVGSPVRECPSADACPPVTVASMGHAVHVHYTDRLFGIDAAAAAARFAQIFESYCGRLIVSLHDVPFLDERPHSVRRRAAYQRIAAIADTVVVSSDVEARRINAMSPASRIHVVRLAVRQPTPAPVGSLSAHRNPLVGIVGFVYPGKGHADVIEAISLLEPKLGVLAMGTASAGHETMVHELRALAAAHRVVFEVTGFVADDRMVQLAQRVAVPVVASSNTSASASLTTWLEAGRRPIVAMTDYTIEFESRCPGSIALYDPAQPSALTYAVNNALDHPSSTWRSEELAPEFSEDATASELGNVYGDRR